MSPEEPRPIEVYEKLRAESMGQEWLVTWFPAHDVPQGRRHGSAGICVTSSGEVVLITQDGQSWGFPGGRPEGDETWEDTLRREVREEACFEVTDPELLGFSRGECTRGHEKGLVLIRSLWLARGSLLEWNPEPETPERRLVAPDEVLSVCAPDPFRPLHHRALIAADLLGPSPSLLRKPMLSNAQVIWECPRREEALRTILYWSDVAHQGGGTFIAPDSVRHVARYLADHPEGVPGIPAEEIIPKCTEFVEISGDVGDFVILHPFMMHASSQNVLGVPRFMSNPPVVLKEPLNLNREDPADFSLLEKATLHCLGMERLNFRPDAPYESHWSVVDET